jgi:hypothetical protein
VHPVYEIIGSYNSYKLEHSINLYDRGSYVGIKRFWIALSCLILCLMFIILLVAEANNYQTGMASVTFTIECIMLLLLLTDAWIIVADIESIEK